LPGRAAKRRERASQLKECESGSDINARRFGAEEDNRGRQESRPDHAQEEQSDRPLQRMKLASAADRDTFHP